MNFKERRCWESDCGQYRIIEMAGGFMPYFKDRWLSIDTFDGAKAQCEAHKAEQDEKDAVQIYQHMQGKRAVE